jgi:hypothetical protein
MFYVLVAENVQYKIIKTQKKNPPFLTTLFAGEAAKKKKNNLGNLIHER